jgi:hypothetical protein
MSENRFGSVAYHIHHCLMLQHKCLCESQDSTDRRNSMEMYWPAHVLWAAPFSLCQVSWVLFVHKALSYRV